MRIILIVLLLSLYSCTKNNQKEFVLKGIEDASLMKKVDSNYEVINVDRAIKVDMDFVKSKLVFVSYIPLNSYDLIGEINKVFVYGDKIYILDAYVAEKVFIFDRQGRLLNTIGNKGQGPNEFAGLSGMSIDVDKKELCLNDRLAMKRLYYDLNGKFIRKEKGFSCFYLNIFNDFVINQLAYQQSFSKDVNYHLISTRNDSVYSKGFPYEPIQKSSTVSKNAVYNSMNDLLFNPVLSDTVYNIKSFDEYCIRYVIKHRRSVWDKRKEELSYNEVANLIKNDGYTSFGGSFYETSKYIYFSMLRKRDKFLVNAYYLFDKKEKQVYELDGKDTRVFKDITPPNILALDGETFVASFDSYHIKETLSDNKSNYVVSNKILKSIIEKSDENSNPVLVFYQLK